MADHVSPIIQDTVASTNLKVKAEGPVDLYLEGFKMLQFHNSQLMTIGNQGIQSWIKNMNEVDPKEASSISELINSKFEAMFSRLLATLSGGQIGNKAANTTPPETGRA